MEELRTSINECYSDFFTEMTKGCDGNKSAARRARKASLRLENLLKEYRFQSVRRENEGSED